MIAARTYVHPSQGDTGPAGVIMGGQAGHRPGRAARKRRQKNESVVQSGMKSGYCCVIVSSKMLLLTSYNSNMFLCLSSVSLCHQLQYVRLMKFLHRQGFTATQLQPALFTGMTLTN